MPNKLPDDTTPRSKQDLLYSILLAIGGGSDGVTKLPAEVTPRSEQDLLYSIMLALQNGGVAPPIASEEEATDGSNNTKMMTPLRVAQAITALAGGGSGVTIVSGQVTLQGNTTAAVSESPAIINLDGSGWDNSMEGTIQITVNGIAHVWTVAINDPGDGTSWINTTGASWGDLASYLETSITGAFFDVVGVVIDGIYLEISTLASGSSQTIVINSSVAGIMVGGGGSSSGTDNVAASGGVFIGDLTNTIAGKKPVILSLEIVGDLDVPVDINNSIGGFVAGGVDPNATFIISPQAAYIDNWRNPPVDSRVTVSVAGTPADATGLSATVYVVAALI